MSEGSGWFVKVVSKKSLAGGKTNDKIETVCALNGTLTIYPLNVQIYTLIRPKGL